MGYNDYSSSLPDRVMRDMAIHSMMVRQSHYINALFKELGEAIIKIKEWEDWKATSKDRHAKGKAKADLAISKNKNTLRIDTTRKRKK